MKTQTKVFTTSDLANRKVSAFYDPAKHSIVLLNAVLRAAFPADIESMGTSRLYYYRSVTPGYWALSADCPNLPVQSLELFTI